MGPRVGAGKRLAAGSLLARFVNLTALVANLTALAAVLCLSGCSGTAVFRPEIPLKAAECGCALTLWSVNATNSKYEFYRVSGGEIGYGGGLSALGRVTTWHAPLTGDQCRALVAVIDQTGWCRQAPIPIEGDDRVEIVLMLGVQSLEVRAPLTDRNAALVQGFLASCCEGRFRGAMERLPQGTDR